MHLDSVIRYWAQVRPEASAFALPTANINYRDFYTTISHFAGVLAGWEVPKGSLVLVDERRTFYHWCAVLALDRLGYRTVSADAAGAAMRLPQLAGIISETPKTVGNLPSITVDDAWLDLAAGTPFRGTVPSTDQRGRVILSSGTTGNPKPIFLSNEMIEGRVRDWSALEPVQNARVAIAMGLNSLAGFLNPLSRWLVGGSVAYGGPEGVVGALVRLNPTMLVVAPTQLQGALRHLPLEYHAPAKLKLVVAGGVLPRALALEAASRLNAEIEIQYGSTEAGVVTAAPLDLSNYTLGSTGFVVPGCAVEILGDDARPAGTGQIGRVRMRSVWMVQSYLDGPDPAFQDGWFYPGDLGYFSPEGGLVIVGRQDDVLNIGGVKISAVSLESELSQVSGVSDVGVVAVSTDGGPSQLAIAVVPNASDWQRVCDAIAARLDRDARLLKFDRLPRNDMGKLLRTDLTAQVLARLRPSAHA